MRRFEWLMGFIAVGTVAGAGATACSSSGSTTTYSSSSQNSDSGTSTGTDASSGTPTDASEEEAASAVPVPTDCLDGSVRLPDGAAGSVSAACVMCVQTSCGSELSACATDCACGPGETCLLSMGYNGSACPAAMSALFNTDPGLTNLQMCVVMMCDSACFGDGG
jgi:hypothetical protein